METENLSSSCNHLLNYVCVVEETENENDFFSFHEKEIIHTYSRLPF